MKELSGTASVPVAASHARCLQLLRAVDGYPLWFGEVVREVTVLERDAGGEPSVVRAMLRVQVGPFAQDVHVLLRVVVDTDEVVLTRIPHESDDPEELLVRWEISEGVVGIQLAARLDVPKLLPLGDVGDGLAERFVQAAAEAVGADAPGSSPNASASSS